MTNAVTSAVTVSGLTKRYGHRTVVDHLSLDLPRGVVAGFIGPNGAGKTTTMAMLLGLVRPSEGAGTVLGRPIDRPAAFLRDVGALIEGPAFYPSISGRRNLEVLAIAGGHDRGQIPHLLEQVDLAGREEDRYRSYSLGMKQRLGIAAALLGDPELLILDEPANGLDPHGVQEMRGLIGRLAGGGRTVLVSSHDLSELEQVCDWVVLIEGGRALYEGPTGDLLDDRGGRLAVIPERRADEARLVALLRDHDFEVGHEDGRIVVRADRRDQPAPAAAVNRLAFEAGIVLVELSPVRATLEERYLSMVEVGVR